MPYADVNGLRLYYEQRGDGSPLVLLHGGLTTIEISFGAVIPVLAEHHRVIAVELQGHGRTADIERPMTFEYLAADVVGLLDHLGIPQADVFGFSLGGLTTYQLLVDHPRRVRRAIVASADHRNDRRGEIDPDRLPTEADFAAMRAAYADVAPDPGHFEAFAAKTVALVQGFGGWSDDQLRGIDLTVLVMIGDSTLGAAGSSRRSRPPTTPPARWPKTSTGGWPRSPSSNTPRSANSNTPAPTRPRPALTAPTSSTASASSATTTYRPRRTKPCATCSTRSP